MRSVFTLGIVAVWLLLIAVLVRKQTPHELPSAPLPVTGLAARDEWFGVYKSGQKIGHAHRVVTPTSGGYTFAEESRVRLAMLGVPQTLETTLRAETDAAYTLRAFDYTLVTPATTFVAHGTSDGKTLHARYGVKGQEANLELPLSEPIALPSTLRPRILADHPAPGTRYSVPVFSPITARSEPLTVIVEGREQLDTPNGVIETVRIAEEQQTVRTRSWIDLDGNVVREEALLGFTLEREPEAKAVAGADTQAPIDLVAVSGIPLDGTIDDPRHLTRLTLRVRGTAAASIPSDPPRQRMSADLLRVAREEVPAAGPAPDVLPADPAAELAAAPFIESDDPAIQAKGREIVAGAPDRVRAARKLVAWVHDHVDKAPSVTVPSAREVLESRRGDCNEHAVLLAALARAAGIPARVIAGAVYANDGFYYHAWNELWVGAWVSADAVFDQFPADATHVKLIEGGLERQVALAGVIGQLAFAVVEEAPQ